MSYTTDHSGAARSSGGDERGISALIDQLRDRDGLKRQSARHKLVEMGPAAVPALIPLLSDPSEQARWEAAKAFTEIPDPRAAEPLAALFRDEDGIRWLAGAALINIGEPAFVPVVRQLLDHADSPRTRDTSARVLRELKRHSPNHPYIDAMLDALHGPAQAETIPWVARGILKQMGLIQPD
ncbi:MAG: HEAT repeat domain-containing protein [Anaerolineae bacterium]|nr:HEAT repeat domain-containing protein [Anaerolineae bacterium]